jgi:hypothetical protein
MIYLNHRAAGDTLPFVVALFNAAGFLVFQVLPLINHITPLDRLLPYLTAGLARFYVTNIPIA